MFRPQAAQELLHTLQGYQMGRITYDRSGPCHESSGFLYYNNRRYFAICSNQKEVKTAIAEQIFRDVVLNAIRTVAELTFPDAPNPMAVEIDSEQLFGSELFPLAVVVSFALYKLDEEWNANLKKEIPTPKFAQPFRGRSRKTIRPLRDLPKNAAEMHPGMVIVHMCPRHKWELLTKPEDFDERDPWYKYVLDVEGDGWKQYEGEARNKKDARWYAAAAACKDLFGVEYKDGEEEEEEQPKEVNYEWYW